MPFCRFARISAHYRHHAEADEAVFQRYVLKLTATLRETKMAALIGTAGPEEAPARITAAIDAIIESTLTSMDAARSAARKTVDTPGEVEKLEAPCNESL